MQRTLRILQLLWSGAGLLAGAPAIARAQSLDSIAANTRIRVELPSAERSRMGRERMQSVSGTLSERRADTLLLVVNTGAPAIRVPVASIRNAYVSRGRPARWLAALEGTVAPALMGAAATSFGMSINRRKGDPSISSAALSSAAWGAASGALFAAWSPRERWHRLTVPAVHTDPSAASGNNVTAR